MNQQISASQTYAAHYACALKVDTANLSMTAESRSKHWEECFISLA